LNPVHLVRSGLDEVTVPMPKKEKYKKKHIPQALREQVWIRSCGESFSHKCLTTWCKNTINVFDFHCGHNIPECKGGKTTVENLVAICNRCNLSMGSQFTFKEWCVNFEDSGFGFGVGVGVRVGSSTVMSTGTDKGKGKVETIEKVKWWCC
jgi:hypothetical protein